MIRNITDSELSKIIKIGIPFENLTASLGTHNFIIYLLKLYWKTEPKFSFFFSEMTNFDFYKLDQVHINKIFTGCWAVFKW